MYTHHTLPLLLFSRLLELCTVAGVSIDELTPCLMHPAEEGCREGRERRETIDA